MASGEALGPEAGSPPRGSATQKQRGGTPLSREQWKNSSVTELELALAQDANSSAFFPLVEAYLEQRRFMEAMVVCKKRIKARPEEVEARGQLARVYVKQNKVSRALQEMDDVVSERDGSAAALAERGQIRLLAGDDKGAVEDLKKALDLDPELERATELLKEKGIVYPEPPPAPTPPPRVVTAAGGAGMVPFPGVPPELRAGSAVGASGGPPPMPRPASMVLDPVTGRPASQISGSFPGSMVPGAGAAVMRGMSGSMVPPRPRLEGEEALEDMANRVAETRPKAGGSAKTTLALAAVCMLLLVVGVGWALRKKYITEGVDRLSQEARPLFEADTYVGYKGAAERYRDIIKDYSGKHKLTLGRYSHSLAILWAEHKESDRLKELEDILAKAKKHAPEVSHTVAAEGIYLLNQGTDRVSAAQKAFEAVSPFVKKVREKNGPPSDANLVLGIIETNLGNYDSAVELLTEVTQQMPLSVRAKVWLGRAKLRAGDLTAANREFGRALQSSKDHLGALAGRALVRIRRGDLDGAGADVMAFEKYARENPKEVSPPDQALIYYARSEAFRFNGQEERANGAYEEALRLDPNNADFPHGLGAWLLKVGRAQEGLKPLRRAVEMEPGRKAFLLSLAEAEVATGDLAGAARRIDELAAARPKDLQVAIAKARILRAKRDPGVEAYLVEVLGWSNDAVMIQRELGELYRAEGQRKKAEEILGKAVNASGGVPSTDQAEILLSYGRVMEEKGEIGTAANTYALASEKGSVEAIFRACSAYSKLDRDKAKGFCGRYVGAGKSLPFAAEAERILSSL